MLCFLGFFVLIKKQRSTHKIKIALKKTKSNDQVPFYSTISWRVQYVGELSSIIRTGLFYIQQFPAKFISFANSPPLPLYIFILKRTSLLTSSRYARPFHGSHDVGTCYVLHEPDGLSVEYHKRNEAFTFGEPLRGGSSMSRIGLFSVFGIGKHPLISGPG